jgi:AcrR family transcriptional regulator
LQAAVVETVGARGFCGTGPADVTAAAGLSEEAFHRHFADMEEAFLSAWSRLTADYAELMTAAHARTHDWQGRMRAIARLTLQFLRADRNRARFLLLEVLHAGEAAQLRRELAIRSQAALIDEGRKLLPSPDVVSPALAEHAAGAVNELLVRQIRSGELFIGGDETMRGLLYLVMRPYFGCGAALRELGGAVPAVAGQQT